jgi:ABC-2 type transport system ATP-binding protein
VSDVAVETSALCRRYGRTLAVDNLELHIPQGAIYGFIGPNGAGKTTTLRMLAGLLAPTSGEIRLLGQRLGRNPALAQRTVGYMPDFFGVYDDLRVWEYLDFWARCHRLPPARRRTTVEQLLELVDLLPQRDAFVQSLSRGMQQRLCLAHALVHDPAILLLDEPASGLDPRARVELRELLKALREMGKTILLSSHILSELAEVCSAIGVIQQGRLLASGDVEQVRRQLRGGQSLRVRLLGEGERARALLHTLPGVQAVRAAGDDGRELQVEVDGDEQVRAAILASLLAAKLPVSDFHSAEDSLEALFLRLTEPGALAARVAGH